MSDLSSLVSAEVNDADNGRNAHCVPHSARAAMGGRPPLARVYVHDADLGDGGGGREAGMPLDDFNDPYARKQAILRGLGLDTGGRAPEGYPNAQLVTVPVPRTRVEASLAVRGDRVSVELEYLAHGDMDAALAVHGAAYVRYLATAWDRWCRTPPANRCRFFRRPLPESASRAVDDRVGGWSAGVPALVPSNFVNRTDRNARPGVDVHAETCWYHTDGDTPVFKGLAPSLAGDMRVVAAIVASMETASRRGSAQSDENAYYYALTTHPGHHAGFSHAGGYCYLNNAAVLARALAASSLNATRVAILDVDYHAGNGTAALFYDDPDVLVCSIHADPNGDYPWNAGYAEDVGCGRGQGKTVNVPLRKGATWANGYEAALEQCLRKIDAHDAQALIVSLGADAHEDDPVQERATAGIALTLRDYQRMGRAIAEAIARPSVPTVFTQEGGYAPETAGAVVRAVFAGMEAGFRRADPERGASAASIERDVLADLERTFPRRGYGGAKAPHADSESESSESESSEPASPSATAPRVNAPGSPGGAKSPKSPSTPRQAAASPKSPKASAMKAPTPAQAKKEPEKKKKRGWFG